MLTPPFITMDSQTCFPLGSAGICQAAVDHAMTDGRVRRWMTGARRAEEAQEHPAAPVADRGHSCPAAAVTPEMPTVLPHSLGCFWCPWPDKEHKDPCLRDSVDKSTCLRDNSDKIYNIHE